MKVKELPSYFRRALHFYKPQVFRYPNRPTEMFFSYNGYHYNPVGLVMLDLGLTLPPNSEDPIEDSIDILGLNASVEMISVALSGRVLSPTAPEDVNAGMALRKELIKEAVDVLGVEAETWEPNSSHTVELEKMNKLIAQLSGTLSHTSP